MSRLTIFRDDQFLEEHVLMRAVVALGRHPENDIVLDDRTLSRFHARLERRGARYVVIDLGAQNGVYLNGSKITGECDLVPGDRIGMGRYVAIFDQDNANPSRQRGNAQRRVDDIGPTTRDANDTVAGEEREEVPAGDPSDEADGFEGRTGPTDQHEDQFEGPTTAVERRAHSPTMVLLYNSLEVSRHPLPRDAKPLVVGRSKGCEIVISLLGLSRRHATVRMENNGVFVEDLGSQNGTWVNNARIEGTRRLRHGDLMNFYEYGLLFLEDPNVEIDYAGVEFGNATSDRDDLEGRETNRQNPPSVQTKPLLQGKEGKPRGPTKRSAIKIGEDSADPSIVDSALDSLNLGEGSYFGDEVDDEFESSMAGQSPLVPEDGTDIVASYSPVDDGADEFHTETKQTLPRGRGKSGKSGKAGKAGKGKGGKAGKAGKKPRGWPTDDELEDVLSSAGSDLLASLDVYMGERLYTQMPLSNDVTRIGSDPRCELALPARVKLAAWHVTLINFGSAAIAYRASPKAKVVADGEDVDQTTLRDGDSLTIGGVRIVYRCR